MAKKKSDSSGSEEHTEKTETAHTPAPAPAPAPVPAPAPAAAREHAAPQMHERRESQTHENAQPRPQERGPSQQFRSAPSNHLFVGKKPVMSYAMSALIQLTQAGEVVVKARGMAISRAVDVAEIVTKRLGNGAFVIKDIKISTEVVGEGAEMRNVSSIEIVVSK